MKSFLLILPLIVGAYSIPMKQHLYDMIHQKENEIRNNMLIQQLATDWGYKRNEWENEEKSLAKESELLLQDYPLPLQQKAETTVSRHILNIPDKAISQRGNLAISNRYWMNPFALIAGQYEKNSEELTDLLLQSALRAGSELETHFSNQFQFPDKQKETQLDRRLSGKIMSINDLLQPQEKIPFHFNIIFTNKPRVAGKLSSQKFFRNFAKLIVPKTTFNSIKVSESNIPPNLKLHKSNHNTDSTMHGSKNSNKLLVSSNFPLSTIESGSVKPTYESESNQPHNSAHYESIAEEPVSNESKSFPTSTAAVMGPAPNSKMSMFSRLTLPAASKSDVQSTLRVPSGLLNSISDKILQAISNSEPNSPISTFSEPSESISSKENDREQALTIPAASLNTTSGRMLEFISNSDLNLPSRSTVFESSEDGNSKTNDFEVPSIGSSNRASDQILFISTPKLSLPSVPKLPKSSETVMSGVDDLSPGLAISDTIPDSTGEFVSFPDSDLSSNSIDSDI